MYMYDVQSPTESVRRKNPPHTHHCKNMHSSPQLRPRHKHKRGHSRSQNSDAGHLRHSDANPIDFILGPGDGIPPAAHLDIPLAGNVQLSDAKVFRRDLVTETAASTTLTFDLVLPKEGATLPPHVNIVTVNTTLA